LTLLHPDLGHFRIGFSIGSKKTWMVSEAANNDQMKLSILGSLKNSKKKKNTTETAIGTHHQDIVPSHFGIFGWENSTVRPFRPWLFLTAKLSFP
jgi:hypothetical protein